MKNHILPAIKLTLVCIVFFVVAYTAVVWGIGQVIAPNHGKGETINYNNSNGILKYGFVNIGQTFTDDKYFWSRPSACGYKADASGGSNKGPTNEDYLKGVSAAIDTFMLKNPDIKKSDIPVEMVTSSGSGLDPNISPKAALIQVPRIAKIRNIPQNKLTDLVNTNTEGPLLGLFGPSKVNVLKLNIALDNLK
jgi:potassium-transporting ATPase KdpC subunit